MGEQASERLEQLAHTSARAVVAAAQTTSGAASEALRAQSAASEGQQALTGQLLTAATCHLVDSVQHAARESSFRVAASVQATLPPPPDAQMRTPPASPR